MWLVSACLLGVSCRYDGEAASPEARRRVLGLLGSVIPVCPEVAGGLGVPRPPAVLVGGDGADVLEGRARVVTEAGDDVTAAFLTGAEAAADAALALGATHACLKARSPSCGAGQVHGPEGLRLGDGVTAALLSRRGLTVLTDEDALEALASGGDLGQGLRATEP